MIRVTYDEFQSSTKIISQGYLISDGEIFFTIHTTVIQQTCSTLSFLQQSTHKTPQTAIQKTNVRNMVSSLPVMTLVDRLGEETLDGLRKECRLSRRVWVKQTSRSKAINDDSLHGTYKLSHRWVIFKTQRVKQ